MVCPFDFSVKILLQQKQKQKEKQKTVIDNSQTNSVYAQSTGVLLQTGVMIKLAQTSSYAVPT